MNKAELIRAVAKRAGIPDVNAKLFFEVLIKRLSEILQPGQAADIPGIGFLQYRMGKLQKKDDLKEDTSLKNNLNLIVYYQNEDEPDANNLIFNIPDIDSHAQDSIEQSFSLSIGKPVIPLKGVKETEYHTPLTGRQLKDLVSSRVETLLSEIKILKDYAKGSEILFITPTKFSRDQFEIRWEDLSADDLDDKIKIETKSNSEEIETTDKIEWEFGADLNKQIEEEAILDTEKDGNSLITRKDNKTQEDNSNWNFGITQDFSSQINKTDTKIDDETELQPEPDLNNLYETDKNKKTEEDETFTKEESDYQKIDTLYKKLLAKQGVDEDKFNLTWSFGEKEQKELEEKDIDKIITKSNFFSDKTTEDEIQEITGVGIPEIKTEEIIEEEIAPEKIFEKEGISKEDKIIFTKEKQPITREKDYKKKTTKGITSAQKSRTYQHTGTYSKRGTSIPFFIGIFVIISIAVILFSVLTNTNLDFLNLTKKQKPEIGKTLFAGTSVINRNYDIPVSINSDKINAGVFNKISKQKPVNKRNIKKRSKNISAKKKNAASPKFKTSRIKELRESMDNVIKATKNKELNISPTKEDKNKVEPAEQFTFDNLPSPVDTAQLHANIFADGNNFTVQVSSWKSPVTAQNEASKLKAKGYDAFVAKALIPGRGYWYRVRVRNFKSTREAENFLLLYQ